MEAACSPETSVLTPLLGVTTKKNSVWIYFIEIKNTSLSYGHPILGHSVYRFENIILIFYELPTLTPFPLCPQDVLYKLLWTRTRAMIIIHSETVLGYVRTLSQYYLEQPKNNRSPLWWETQLISSVFRSTISHHCTWLPSGGKPTWCRCS
jgi:hypothetical protein